MTTCAVRAAPLSWKHLRRFGNFSYSYYLVHAFVVILAVRLVISTLAGHGPNLVFWCGIIPIFAASYCAGAALFLCVEKPYSLRQKISVAEPAPAQRLAS